MGPPLSNSASPQSPKLDRFSFVKYVKNIGRAYRTQATELVSICRTFFAVQEQTPSSYAQLREALQLVDDALQSATDVGKWTPKEVDEKFAKAINRMCHYESDFHPSRPKIVAKKMEAAKSKDKTSSTTILKVLKEKLSLKATEDKSPEPTTVVEFLLLKCLPDDSPTRVQQVLSPKSSLKEILWNFSRFKDKRRLTLKQNPHFYKVSDLPTSPEAYVGEFETKPINENFQHAKIYYVLTDNPATAGRVFLETAKKKRAFGNTWVPENAIIFKDVCGKLEGENIVGADIQDTSDLWYFEEPLQSPISPVSSPKRSDPSPTITATPINSVDGIRMQRIQDWGECREPIRRMVSSRDVNIRITAKPRSSTSPTSSAPPSPIPSPSPINSDGSISSIVLSDSRPSIKVQIPAPSTPAGPLSADYRTARDTPLSQRSPIAGLPLRAPASLSPAPPAASFQPTSTVVPPASAASLSGPLPHSPIVALPLSGPAIPAPPTADIPQGRETALLEAQIPSRASTASRASIAGNTSSGPNVTITEPLHFISVPHGQGNEDRHVTPDAPVPDPQPQRAGLPPNQGGGGPPPSDLSAQHPPVQTEVADSQPQPRARKRNWFQKFLWDYKKDKKD